MTLAKDELTDPTIATKANPSYAAVPPAPALSSGSSQGNIHYLSALTPSYVANGWGTVGINTSVGGGPITIAGTQYAHGLGVHAFSELDYPLPPLGGCSSFTAMVGVDDEVWWGLGQIQFQVWADGVETWASSWLDKGTPPQSINLNVTGVQKSRTMVPSTGITPTGRTHSSCVPTDL